MNSVVTEHTEICIFCGRQAECEHHLVFGTAGRELSEKDGLKIPVCNNCHNMGDKLHRIHDNPMAERLSKMLGQAIWEKELILNGDAEIMTEIEMNLGGVKVQKEERMERRKELMKKTARELFRKRYGKSYL